MPDATSALRAARLLSQQQDHVLTWSQVVEVGVPVALARTLVASRAWRRLVRGTYLLEPEVGRRELDRAWARSGQLLVPGSVVSHHSAAAVLGIRGAPRAGAVHVSRAAKALPRQYLVTHRCAVPAADVVDIDGLLVTGPERTLGDLVPLLDRFQALSVLDSALFKGLTTDSGLRTAEARARRLPGYHRSQDVWRVPDGRAQSPLESRTRLRCLDDGLVPADLQVEVLDRDGRLIAVADLSFHRSTAGAVDGWVTTGSGLQVPVPPGSDLPPLLAEADGLRFHPDGADVEDPAQAAAFVWDRRRQNAVTALGHPVVRVTWSDTLSRRAVPDAVRAQLPRERPEERSDDAA